MITTQVDQFLLWSVWLGWLLDYFLISETAFDISYNLQNRILTAVWVSKKSSSDIIILGESHFRFSTFILNLQHTPVLNGLSREYILRSQVNLNNIGLRDNISSMEQKCHRWYYINLLIYGYLSCDRQGRLAIDGTGSRSIKRKFHWRVLSIFWIMIFQISQIFTNPKVNLSLASQMKCENMFSDPQLDKIFSHFSVIFQLRT